MPDNNDSPGLDNRIKAGALRAAGYLVMDPQEVLELLTGPWTGGLTDGYLWGLMGYPPGYTSVADCPAGHLGDTDGRAEHRDCLKKIIAGGKDQTA